MPKLITSFDNYLIVSRGQQVLLCKGAVSVDGDSAAVHLYRFGVFDATANRYEWFGKRLSVFRIVYFNTESSEQYSCSKESVPEYHDKQYSYEDMVDFYGVFTHDAGGSLQLTVDRVCVRIS